MSTWHSLFNEADGSITTDLLTLNGDVTFYNNGDFTGSIAGTRFVFSSKITFFGLIIAQLALVFVLSGLVHKLSAGMATTLFMLY
ncbi:hypothetical protein ONQ62_26030, partial [Salmonella enterica subsp. enterica serovar Virginia]|nr:hypothetical protein [Salmonella enterica subsp. enterica serovar Virginia]